MLTMTLSTWPVRAAMGEFTGGRAFPSEEELPPLELKCRLIVKNVASPSAVCHCATKGFLVAFQTPLVGSMRPGLTLKVHHVSDYMQASTAILCTLM